MERRLGIASWRFKSGFCRMSFAEPSFQNPWRFKSCKEFGPVIGVLPEILGVADDCTFVCVCVHRYTTVCWYLGPQGQPDPAECSRVFVGSFKESVCVHSGEQEGGCLLWGSQNFGGPSCCFSKPSMRGALMGFCPWLQARRLRGAQSHEAGWPLG